MHALLLSLLLAATVHGTVTVNGDPLPGATVTITDAHGRKRTAVTDISGSYSVAGVDAPYSVTAEMVGMRVKRVRGNDIRMRADATVSTWIVTEPVHPDAPHYTYGRPANTPLPLPVW